MTSGTASGCMGPGHGRDPAQTCRRALCLGSWRPSGARAISTFNSINQCVANMFWWADHVAVPSGLHGAWDKLGWVAQGGQAIQTHQLRGCNGSEGAAVQMLYIAMCFMVYHWLLMHRCMSLEPSHFHAWASEACMNSTCSCASSMVL